MLKCWMVPDHGLGYDSAMCGTSYSDSLCWNVLDVNCCECLSLMELEEQIEWEVDDVG